MDGEGATASTDAYAIAYIVPPDPSLPESPLKACDDPFAVDETPPTGSALTAAAKPASPWAMWASPCVPWNSAKALPAAAAPAAKASLLAAIQAKKSEEKTDEEKAAIMMQKIRRGTLARRAGDAGGTKVKGWGAVRAARRRYSVAQRLQGLTAMPGYAVKAARSGAMLPSWRARISRSSSASAAAASSCRFAVACSCLAKATVVYICASCCSFSRFPSKASASCARSLAASSDSLALSALAPASARCVASSRPSFA